MQATTTKAPIDVSGWNITVAQRDTLESFFKQYRRLERESIRLRSQVDSKSLDLAKNMAERENLQRLYQYYLEEMESMRKDLEYAESQFISLENRIQSGESKASAVAAQAETKIALDKFMRKNPAAADTLMLATVRDKFKNSESCLERGQYSASVYYSKRALKTLEFIERMHSIPRNGVEAYIVSTEKANMRKGPGTSFAIVGRLPYGTVLVQLDRKDDWRKVKTEAGKEGWIHQDLIR